MTTIIVKDAEGNTQHVEARDGLSVMEVLRPLDIGIEGECEGSIACATCHVQVEPSWFDRIPPASDDEADMLDCVFGVGPTSRLGCQIAVDPSLDGVVLSIPSRSPRADEL